MVNLLTVKTSPTPLVNSSDLMCYSKCILAVFLTEMQVKKLPAVSCEVRSRVRG